MADSKEESSGLSDELSSDALVKFSNQVSEDSRFHEKPPMFSQWAKDQDGSSRWLMLNSAVGNAGATVPRSIAQVAQDSDALLRVPSMALHASAFSVELAGNVEDVRMQLRNGKRMCKRVKTFMDEQHTLNREQILARKLFVEQEMEALRKIDPNGDDGMLSVAGAWDKIVDALSKESMIEDVLNSELEQMVLKPLNNTYELSKRSIRDSDLELQKVIEPVKFARTQMMKEKSKCNKHIDNLNRTAFKSKSPKKKQETYKEVIVSCTKYEEDVDMANQILSTCSTIQLPLILSKMQTNEQTRVQNLKNVMLQYSDLLIKQADEMKKIALSVKAAAEEIDYKEDVTNFVQYVKTRSQAPQYIKPVDASFDWNLDPFYYDLSMTTREVTSKMREEDLKMFQKSLKEIMDAQRAGPAPFNTMKVPRVFAALKRGIEELGGCKTEGIFRVSADEGEISDVLFGLEDGNFDIEVSTPHVLSSVLKKWLRDLENPLIPSTLYEACIELANKKPDGNDFNTALAVMLPRDNRCVLEGLVDLLRKVSHFENSDVNKMDSKKLAICFAPTILKDPALDKAVMLANVQSAISFVALCIQNLEINHYTANDEVNVGTYKLIEKQPKKQDIDKGPNVDEVNDSKEESEEPARLVPKSTPSDPKTRRRSRSHMVPGPRALPDGVNDILNELPSNRESRVDSGSVSPGVDVKNIPKRRSFLSRAQPTPREKKEKIDEPRNSTSNIMSPGSIFKNLRGPKL